MLITKKNKKQNQNKIWIVAHNGIFGPQLITLHMCRHLLTHKHHISQTWPPTLPEMNNYAHAVVCSLYHVWRATVSRHGPWWRGPQEEMRGWWELGSPSSYYNTTMLWAGFWTSAVSALSARLWMGSCVSALSLLGAQRHGLKQGAPFMHSLIFPH